ncbi:radical SAM/SPASM domain-containing protein [Nonomuraea sp. NPDC049714]|uniref:radical SAM/SPASM domain-containing protein n=1 Tax=Nonomuraea sp. NPDC049714 TaxID=3364357 RepID=UPI0037B94F06
MISDWTVRRETNRRINLEEFERRATALISRPRVLFVELTENCNLACPMCRSAGPFEKSKNMKQELFDRIAEELFPTAEIVDLRGWGESAILKQFPEFVEKTLAYGCRVRLVTNLTVSNERLWRRLVSSGALITVSFDAAEQETFGALRKGTKLDIVLRNLEILADEGHRSGVGTGNIHLNVVVQTAALQELIGIVGHAARLGLSIRLNPVSLGDEDPDNPRFHREELLDRLRQSAAAAEKENVEVQLNAALAPEWAAPEHADKTCTHPWMYCYINHRGEVGFCDHLIGVPGNQYLLGNLSVSEFGQIWNGPAYRQLRAEHTVGRSAISSRFEECRWCYSNRYTDFDELSYPPYEKHRVLLTSAACASFQPLPSDRRPLPLIAPLPLTEEGSDS